MNGSAWKWLVLGLLALGLLLAGGWFAYLRWWIETPGYEVLERFEGGEIRRYRPRVAAEVELEGEMREVSGAGFRALAGYIFGGNQSERKISMTAPVDLRPAPQKPEGSVELQGAGRKWRMTFTMPSGLRLEELPDPDNPKVVLREIPTSTYAATRFSGDPTAEEIEGYAEQLRIQLEANGLTAAGPPIYSRFDDPSIPGPLRKNELLIPVEGVD